jgi:hypothetical protein
LQQGLRVFGGSYFRSDWSPNWSPQPSVASSAAHRATRALRPPHRPRPGAATPASSLVPARWAGRELRACLTGAHALSSGGPTATAHRSDCQLPLRLALLVDGPPTGLERELRPTQRVPSCGLRWFVSRASLSPLGCYSTSYYTT